MFGVHFARCRSKAIVFVPQLLSADAVQRYVSFRPARLMTLRKNGAITLDADVMATDRPITCNQCNKSLVSSENELRNAVKVAQEGHADASGLQITGWLVYIPCGTDAQVA